MQVKRTIYVGITDFAKKHTFFRKCVRKIVHTTKFIRFKIRGIRKKVDDKTIILFAFKGKSYSCSPKAIYEYMQNEEKYEQYKYIWAFEKPENYDFLRKNKNTEVIKYGGRTFEKKLAVAKYWIVNYRVEDHIYPKKNQVYVQCWHGTPLKRLGYDLKNINSAMNSDEEIYSRYKIDAKKFNYILSPSHFASEKFITAWNLKNTKMLYKVIEEGYPRNDFLYNYTSDDLKQIKQKLKIPEDKKVLLYAPTYRDNQHKSGVGYVYQTKVNFDFLKEKLQEEYVILFRAHYLVSNSFDFEKYKGFIYNVSEYDDINHLYIISDLLITDYSSVFFDYANLKRPIIFYMYDLEEYKEELRGFYLNISELPGEIVQTQEKLIDSIENTKRFVYNKNYQLFNNKYNYLDDGQASKRVVEKIIK